jgi:hypothetical protein
LPPPTTVAKGWVHPESLYRRTFVQILPPASAQPGFKSLVAEPLDEVVVSSYYPNGEVIQIKAKSVKTILYSLGDRKSGRSGLLLKPDIYHFQIDERTFRAMFLGLSWLGKSNFLLGVLTVGDNVFLCLFEIVWAY